MSIVKAILECRITVWTTLGCGPSLPAKHHTYAAASGNRAPHPRRSSSQKVAALAAGSSCGIVHRFASHSFHGPQPSPARSIRAMFVSWGMVNTCVSGSVGHVGTQGGHQLRLDELASVLAVLRRAGLTDDEWRIFVQE